MNHYTVNGRKWITYNVSPAPRRGEAPAVRCTAKHSAQQVTRAFRQAGRGACFFARTKSQEDGMCPGMGMSHEDRAWLEGRLKDFRDSVRADQQAMEGRIMMRLADMQGQASKRLDDHDEIIREHDGRIRGLEIDQGRRSGRAAGFGVFIGGLIAGAAGWLWQTITGGRS